MSTSVYEATSPSRQYLEQQCVAVCSMGRVDQVPQELFAEAEMKRSPLHKET